MLTPRFSLTQTDEEICIKIYAKFARISDAEVNIQDDVFTFFSSPYYLRLHLPGKLRDSEEEKHMASYDADAGTFNITCIKQIIGEFFPKLDMLTDLLTPRGSSSLTGPQIEVLHNGSSPESTSATEDEEEFDWLYIQALPTEENESSLGFKYGFANSKTGIFATLKSELQGIVEICDPDNKPITKRRAERLSHEEEHFDENHYLADLFDTDTQYLNFEPFFYKVESKDAKYTEAEEKTLLELPRKELLIDKGSSANIYFSLVDILFAWCYNHRVTLGENCAESAWNIVKISSTLSWLESFPDLKSTMISCMRRTLIFPLVRNWDFSLKVAEDTSKILSLGRRRVLKCLLEIHTMFNAYDPYYLLNQLYVTEYSIWIQSVNELKLSSLADSLRKLSLTKDCLNLELQELESAAKMVIEEDINQGAKSNDISPESPIDPSKNDKEQPCNPNDLLQQIEQMTIIENEFALSRNDNDADPVFTVERNQNLHLIEDVSEESASDSDDSSDTDSESTENEGGTDSDTNSNSTLDSDDSSGEDQG